MGRHSAKGLKRFAGPARAGASSTVADIQLVLHDRVLLLRCCAALALPFAVFFAIIVALGKVHDWALLIFAPMVLAGVLLGWQLDRAYASQSARNQSARNQSGRDKPAVVPPIVVQPIVVQPIVVQPIVDQPADAADIAAPAAVTADE